MGCTVDGVVQSHDGERGTRAKKIQGNGSFKGGTVQYLVFDKITKLFLGNSSKRQRGKPKDAGQLS